jgi:hypothetical protein
VGGLQRRYRAELAQPSAILLPFEGQDESQKYQHLKEKIQIKLYKLLTGSFFMAISTHVP